MGTAILVLLNLAWLVPFVVYMVRLSQRANASRDERRRLLETGRPATAVVVAITETGPYYGRVPHLDVQLRVQPEGEPPYEATARAFFRLVDLPRVQPGATVEVRVQPDDRTRVAIVGDALY